MKKKLFGVAMLAIGMLTSCGQKSTNDGFVHISGNIPDSSADGVYIYLLSQTGNSPDTLARAQVQKGTFHFDSIKPDTTAYAVLEVGAFSQYVILEAGQISARITERTATGTKLNNQLASYYRRVDSLATPFHKRAEEIYTKNAPDMDSLLKQWDVDYRRTMLAEHLQSLKQNANSIIGVHVMMNLLRDIEPTAEEMRQWRKLAGDVIMKHPIIERMMNIFDSADATAAGTMYKDFSGTDTTGKTLKLSDYVGKGHYVLVDFWSSWCGPCRRAMPELKELHAKYAPKGLQILGVAVWDEMPAHIKALKELELPWAQIFVEEDKATAPYGVTSIPHVMLIAPDGKIVARDLQGTDIAALIEAELAKNGGKL